MSPRDHKSPCSPKALDPLLIAETVHELALESLPIALKFTGASEGALCVRHQNDSHVFGLNEMGRIDRIPAASDNHTFYENMKVGRSGHWYVHRVGNKECTLSILLKDAAATIPETFPTWASVLFLKAQSLSAQSLAQMEKTRYTRWFETLDGQLRVLERERQKLAMLVNKSESGAVVVDSNYKIRWINPALAKRFNMEANPSAMAGRDCHVLCGAEKTCHDCPVRNVLEHKRVFHDERTQVTPQATRHYYLSAFPLLSPTAEVEEVLMTIQDLTDLQTLRKSEARYNTLFQRSANAIFMADTGTFEIMMANRQAQILTGLDEDTILHQTLLNLHPDTNQTTMQGFYERLAKGEPLDNVEAEVVDGDGNVLTCNLCGTLFDLDEKQVMQVEYRDVTQLRALQRELVRAEHLITLGTMNAGIAHEFKNRLAPLRAFAQMLTLEGRNPEQLLKHGPVIVNEVDRLSNLVGDVLDYARPNHPSLDEQNLTALFKDLVKELTNEYRPRLEQAKIQVSTDIPEDIYSPVHIDSDQIRRAYINLFKNSVEACEQGGDYEKIIHIQMEAQEKHVLLHMADTGCGIPPKDLERIFDPFFSTKGPKGTGLGMCIVKSLIETNQGTIDISSVPGKGTTVRLTFERQGESEQAA